ncbi:alanine racemase [Tessaracoccus antarcticus]|uniref:Alanine racemase n=1 Tax=Tessaracoccus antarcticus TaxID=2479848 RepID=A0A3M0GVN3_9ACTN|nr:alanine racemase [Tessaracoccus antarcticus]RMB61396.1 alanine racemase [Tessaracoccus antarcticus]
MTLRLTVATSQWRAHQRSLIADVPGAVPVAKGNGYGFGLDVLAVEASKLRTDALAVGIAQEVATVRAAGWNRDVVVLNPWRPGDTAATDLLADPRVITMVSRASDLESIQHSHPHARVQLEIQTSMHRHGMLGSDLPLDLGTLQFEGWSIHLPSEGSLKEATALASMALSCRRGAIWMSHLSVADYRVLRTSVGVQTRMRIGTRLWLGAPSALETTATVLDVHRISRGERLGYHQTKAPRDGFIVIVSGGTAHGIALAAPVPQRSLRQRGVTVAEGLMAAAGRTLSPFTIAGRKRPFAEPPHMHSSMLWMTGAEPGVEVGDEIPVTCRMTTTSFDEVILT